MVKSITEEILGSGAHIKILDYLLDCKDIDCAVSDLAEGSNISRQYAYKIVEKLMKFGVVEKSRIVGRTQLYKIAKDNSIARKLLEFNNEILKYQVKRFEEKHNQNGRGRK